MPKFDDSGFYASPIQQYPLELIIVAVSVFLYMIQSLITEKGSTSQYVIKQIRIGAMLAFMYQLILASSVCVYKIGGILVFGNLDDFSGGRLSPSQNKSYLLENEASLSSAGINSSGLRGVATGTDSSITSQVRGLDLYCHISLIVSVFIIFYYCLSIFGNILSNSASTIKTNTQHLRHLNPTLRSLPANKSFRIREYWNYLAFDKDMFLFEHNSIGNYVEILSHFLIALAMPLFSNKGIISSVIVVFLIIVQFVLFSVNHGLRNQEIVRETRRMKFLIQSKIGKIYAKYDQELSIKKITKNTPKGLRIIRMDDKVVGGTQEKFDINQLLLESKVDEYGIRLDYVSFWKNFGGHLNLLIGGLILVAWLTYKSRGMKGCLVYGYIYCTLVGCSVLCSLFTLLYRYLGKSNTISLITDRQMKDIDELNKKIEDQNKAVNVNVNDDDDDEFHNTTNRLEKGETSRPLFTNQDAGSSSNIKQKNRVEISEDDDEDWDVNFDIPSEKKQKKGEDFVLGSNYKTNQLPSTDRHFQNNKGPMDSEDEEKEQDYQDYENSGEDHNKKQNYHKNKLSITGFPEKLPMQSGFVNPSITHTDDLTSRLTGSSKSQQKYSQNTQSKLQSLKSEKSKNGNILNEMDTNRSKKHVDRNIITEFEVSTKENKQPVLNSNTGILDSENIMAKEGPISIGIEQDIEILKIMNNLDRESKEVDYCVEAVKNQSKRKPKDVGSEKENDGDDDARNLDQYKLDGDFDTSMDVDFELGDIRIQEISNYDGGNEYSYEQDEEDFEEGFEEVEEEKTIDFSD